MGCPWRYLRGEQQSTDAAGQAAMSDYLKEIEAMKLEEEKQTATIAQQSAEMGELHQAVRTRPAFFCSERFSMCYSSPGPAESRCQRRALFFLGRI